MPDLKLSGLTSAPSVDRTADLLYLVKSTGLISYKATPNFVLGITGNPVGDSDTQTLTAKTLTSPTISNPTLSGTLSGTYTIGGTPTFPANVLTTTNTVTVTNKTLTSPTINTATIVNPTITADSIAGFTTSNTGTIYGVSVVAGVIASGALANSVNAAALQSGSVLSGKLGLSNAFTGGVASQANAGTAGGTMFYINLGGIKMLWLITPSLTSSVGGNAYTVTLPTSFFSTIQHLVGGTATQAVTGNQYAVVDSFSSTTVTLKLTSPSGSATQVASLFVIGI